MNVDESQIVFPERLADVFRLLRSGRHLCVDDGKNFRDLELHEQQYTNLFRSLGYDLVRHGQGFYYFGGSNSLSTKGLRAITLFMMILFQHLEDNKFSDPDRAWERTLTHRIFEINKLPHFETAQRRALMFSLGIDPENLRERVLRLMSRLGMLSLRGGNQFQFRAPIYRFVELCMEFSVEEVVTNDPIANESTDTEESEGYDAGQWEDVEDSEA